MATIHGIGAINAPQPVIKAIKTASAQTGVDFSYLVNQAKAESSFNPTAKAKTSSATGLFQFIESTWMNLVNKHGTKYGLDGLNRQELLAKRNDPALSSMMAAELATENKAIVEAKMGKKAGATELYFAHFLGASVASNFLNAHQETPHAKAAELFPAAAKANKNVFFEKNGQMRTLDDVYAFFDKKFQAAPVAQETRIAEVKQAVPETYHAPIERFEPEIQRMIWSSLLGDLPSIALIDSWAEQQTISRLLFTDISLFSE